MRSFRFLTLSVTVCAISFVAAVRAASESGEAMVGLMHRW